MCSQLKFLMAAFEFIQHLVHRAMSRVEARSKKYMAELVFFEIDPPHSYFWFKKPCPYPGVSIRALAEQSGPLRTRTGYALSK